MTFKYFKKLEELEELAESKAGGHFSGFWTLILAILRSRYLLVSVCFYLVLLMVFGSVVVSRYVINNAIDIFTPSEGVFIRPPGPSEPRPVSGPRSKPPGIPGDEKLRQPSFLDLFTEGVRKKNKGDRIVILTPTSPHPKNQFVPPPVQLPDLKPTTPLAEKISIERGKRLQKVLDYQKNWVKKTGEGPFGRDGNRGAERAELPGDAGIAPPGKHHNIHAEFTIFQAKYHEGDWNCNGPYNSGTNDWDLSSLKNFMFQVRQWSRDRIKASVVPQVLDIGTDQIFTLKPPFIYLTGHKDFHFLEEEVKNLRDYLTLGGCIWADSALAGRRSRFDIAFRREIKRVLPDRDFEIVKPDHEMFNTYFKDINIPGGINFYHEPVEIINIDDEMVVLYTLNGYGHFWESRLNRDGKIARSPVNFGRPGRPFWQYVYGPHLSGPDSGVIYRNINDETVGAAYKFGINVLVCLLTQYDDKFKFLPKNLPAIEPRPKPLLQ